MKTFLPVLILEAVSVILMIFSNLYCKKNTYASAFLALATFVISFIAVALLYTFGFFEFIAAIASVSSFGASLCIDGGRNMRYVILTTLYYVSIISLFIFLLK